MKPISVVRSSCLLAMMIFAGACARQPEPPAIVIPPSATPIPKTRVPNTPTPTFTPTSTLRPSSTPLPTFTLAPSLTPFPTPTLTPAILGIGTTSGALRDDFSDPLSGWVSEYGEGWSFFYQNNAYTIINNTPRADVSSSRTRFHTDFIIEVDVTKISGPNDAFFGVTCRSTGFNYYSLNITGNGQYEIYKSVASKRELLVSGSSNAIETGNETNHLMATCIGNTLTLFVNGAKVVEHFDLGPLSGAFVGLLLGTKDAVPVTVSFDNFDSYPAQNAPPLPTFTPTGTQPTATPTGTLPTPTPTRTVTPTP